MIDNEQKLENAFWDRYIAYISLGNEVPNDMLEIIKNNYVYFLEHLEIYIDKYWDLRAHSKARSNKLLDFLEHLEINDDKEIKNKVRELKNLLSHIPYNKENEYYLKEYILRYQELEDNITHVEINVEITEEFMQNIKDLVDTCLINEAGILGAFQFPVEEYYKNYIQDISLAEWTIPSIKGIIKDFPELLDNPDINQRLECILELKKGVYDLNKIGSRDTEYELLFDIPESSNVLDFHYTYPREKVKVMKSFKEQESVKRLYKKLYKES